jgi:DNA-binding transcriptional LysR family regulator
MHWKNALIESLHEPASASLDLRHFDAFQQVYRARDLTVAGHELRTTRKTMRRMMDNLEKAFQCPLFSEPTRGQLVPSPFADRLFNDLRFLNSAQQLLEERIQATHDAGRILRVGTSPTVFRTSVLRTVFRTLQTIQGIRPTYVPVQADESSKAIASGNCDIHIGTRPCEEKRFLCEVITHLDLIPIARTGDGMMRNISHTGTISAHVVSLDHKTPTFKFPSHLNLRALPESNWLRWIDHPEECPAGTIIFAPDVPSDTTHWSRADSENLSPLQKPLYLTCLRQHPYEFLPSLGGVIQSRLSRL